jgi:EPS-associated MarR family transcriptional regulator
MMKPAIYNAQIFRDISKNPSISQRELALNNRISLGKVNYAIKSLVEKGYIKVQNFSRSKNKRKYMYVLTPSGMYEKAKLTTVFLKWKMEEYERIKREIEELEQEINGYGQQGMVTEQRKTDSLVNEQVR